MANTLVQFRTEESIRVKAVEICEELGMDLPTYLRMCVVRLVQENGVPFSMKVNSKKENKGMLALIAANKIAEENGIADMSLEEINAEIADSRK